MQALSHAHHEELHRILMETCHEGEGSALRTRLLELQESLDEQHRVGAQVCVCVCVDGWVGGWVQSYTPDHEINLTSFKGALWRCDLMCKLPVGAVNQTCPLV